MFPYLLILLATLTHAIIVRGPRGPYAVSYEVETLEDDSRRDPYAPEDTPSKRRIVVSIFRPVEADQNGCQQEVIPYLPPATEQTYHAVFEAMGSEFPLFNGLELEFCGAEPGSHRGDFPVVVFSPGFSVTRLLAGAQAQALASEGNIVITVDHPYEATIVEFPDGKVIYGFNASDVNDEIAQKAVKVRADDVSFLVDQLPQLLNASCNGPDTSKVFVYGHSLGGATAALAAYQDKRVLGGLDFDGKIEDPVAQAGLDKPFVIAAQPMFANQTAPFDGFVDNLRGPKMLLSIDEAVHLSFLDGPLLVSLREDIPPGLIPALQAIFGSIDGLRLASGLNEILQGMVEFLFRDNGQRLCNLAESFSEVRTVVQELVC